MAVTKAALYDNALLLLGQRRLDSITEDRASRYYLDSAYDLGAIDHCLELIQPVFASRTSKLTSSAVSTEHDLDNVFTLPTDYVHIVGVYSDAKLDQPITRYIIEAGTLACEYATVYLRYTSNDASYGYDFTKYSPGFAEFVAVYLATKIVSKAAPEELESIAARYKVAFETTKASELAKEPVRSSGTTVTLTNEWRYIYNDALLIMGLDEITSNTDDSDRRTKLDRALDAGLVSSVLEDTMWTFGTTSTKIQYNPSVEPAWGYRRAIDKPTDLHRINGIFVDEYMNTPLKLYRDEGSYFFCDHDEVYLEYVSSDWIATPASWPTSFKRLVAARLAKDAATSLIKYGANPDRANFEYEDRKNTAMSNDAMAAPPRVLSGGNWVGSRFRGSNRGRP